MRYVAPMKRDLFITFPLPKTPESTLPNYNPIGRHAFNLAKVILDKAPYVRRSDVYKVVAQMRTSDSPTSEALVGPYRFGSDGENTKMPYQTFRIVPPPDFVTPVIW